MVLHRPAETATLFGMPIYQRADFDFDAPLGRYSPDRAVNIGNNAWALNPYYAVTLYPAKHFETSWRVHYTLDLHRPPPRQHPLRHHPDQPLQRDRLLPDHQKCLRRRHAPPGWTDVRDQGGDGIE